MDEKLSRHERRQLARQQREQAKSEQIIQRVSSKRKKKVVTYITVALIIFGISAGSLFLLINSSNKGKDLIPFAECLTENGAVMYGAFWCPHCADQKSYFGKSFEQINYVECDARGKNAQPEVCKQENIQGYPTWKINGELIGSGVISLERLSAETGCLLP